MILSDRKRDKIWFNSYNVIFSCEFFVAFHNDSKIPSLALL